MVRVLKNAAAASLADPKLFRSDISHKAQILNDSEDSFDSTDEDSEEIFDSEGTVEESTDVKTDRDEEEVDSLGSLTDLEDFTEESAEEEEQVDSTTPVHATYRNDTFDDTDDDESIQDDSDTGEYYSAPSSPILAAQNDASNLYSPDVLNLNALWITRRRKVAFTNDSNTISHKQEELDSHLELREIDEARSDDFESNSDDDGNMILSFCKKSSFGNSHTNCYIAILR